MGEYSPIADAITINAIALPAVPEQPTTFPKNAELKIQILRVFDFVGKASKLLEIQNEYDKLNDGHYPLRDTIRSLQNSKLLVMIKLKTATRGFLWAKADWIENGHLLPQYKPEGFDLFYKADNLIYE